MEIPKTITRKWLEGQDACGGGIRRFSRVFPKGMRVTAANLRKAARKGLDVYWLAYEHDLSRGPAIAFIDSAGVLRRAGRVSEGRYVSDQSIEIIAAEALIFALELE